MTSRAVVEQAKGVLSYRRGVDMAQAYELLLKELEMRSGSLVETARGVVHSSYGGSAADNRGTTGM